MIWLLQPLGLLLHVDFVMTDRMATATVDQLCAVTELMRDATLAESRGDAVAAASMIAAAVKRAQMLLPNVPRAHAEVLSKHIAAMNLRFEGLVVSINKATTAASTLVLPPFPVPFDPHGMAISPKITFPSTAPTEPQITMALWRQLSDSMQAGAYLTPDIFMPRMAWFQSGGTATIRALDAKVRFLTGIADVFEKLRSEDEREKATVDEILNALAEALERTERLKENFLSDVGGGVAQRSKMDRSVRELIHQHAGGFLKGWKVQQDATQSTYIAWCANSLLQLRVFERLLARHGKSPKFQVLVTSIIRLVQALTQFTQFLLHDAFLLLKRYTSSMRVACTNLVPDASWEPGV